MTGQIGLKSVSNDISDLFLYVLLRCFAQQRNNNI